MAAFVLSLSVLAGINPARMKIETLHIGMRIKHPQYGEGAVKSLTEHTADIRFDDGTTRTIAPQTSDIEPLEALATLSGMNMPVAQLIERTVKQMVHELGLEKSEAIMNELAPRWRKGKMVLQPADTSLQAKEVELDVFFHKIVMMRNNLRVLEQKVNGNETLASADKFDWQQYITRCYGSMTTFNLLFKDKESYF